MVLLPSVCLPQAGPSVLPGCHDEPTGGLGFVLCISHYLPPQQFFISPYSCKPLPPLYQSALPFQGQKEQAIVLLSSLQVRFATSNLPSFCQENISSGIMQRCKSRDISSPLKHRQRSTAAEVWLSGSRRTIQTGKPRHFQAADLRLISCTLV